MHACVILQCEHGMPAGRCKCPGNGEPPTIRIVGCPDDCVEGQRERRIERERRRAELQAALDAECEYQRRTEREQAETRARIEEERDYYNSLAVDPQHCANCGEPIVYSPRSHGPWNTGWLHVGGENHCNRDPNSNDPRRGMPDTQQRLL